MTAAAFFDVDGTLTRTTVLDPLIWYQRAHLPRPRYWLWAAGLLWQIPRYLWADRRSRKDFNHLFFRRYAGMKCESLREWHRTAFPETLQRVVFPAALECVRQHQRAGRRIVLATGGLDFVIQPLAELLRVDELIALSLVERDGVFTGELSGDPIADERKATLVGDYASRCGIDLAQSYAYGNNASDAPMLACTGHAIAVNPDRRLRRLARERGWEMLQWR